jgi:chemotaxis signal transduction protein
MSEAGSRTISPTGRRHAILAARARRLARRLGAPEPVASINCLVCEAGGQLFGLPLVRMARVVPTARTAHVPTSNPALLGVASRGGVFYQVYDLARLAGAGAGGADGHIVLLRGTPAKALRVDRALRVADVVALASGDAPQLQAGQSVVSGFARPLQAELFEGRIISLIDPDKIAPDHAPGDVEGD